MDGQRKGSQSSRSLAITSGGHVTDTDHMVSRPKKVASLLPCPDGQPHEEPESDRAATPFQITMPDRIFVHMVKRAKPRRSQDGRLVVAGMVGLDGGILAAGGESEEVATIRLEVEPPMSSAGKVSQYRAQASARSSHCQCH